MNGASVGVRLQKLPSSLIVMQGENFRVGQIGSLYSIKVGLVKLVAICDGVQAGNIRDEILVPAEDLSDHLMSLTLFGEIFQGKFQRGVGQYPTIGDTVHLVPEQLLRSIYESNPDYSFELGTLSAAPTVSATINLDKFITRHSAIFGATGSGKSNFVSLCLDAISNEQLPGARCLVIDPHGEFSHLGTCFSTISEKGKEDLQLPYWALPLDALFDICQLRPTTPPNETALREWVYDKKLSYAEENGLAVSFDRITADSPIPFSIRELWFEFYDQEIATYTTAQRTTKCEPTTKGDTKKLIGNKYPPHAAGNAVPFAPAPRGLARQLDSLRSTILDMRYAFTFHERYDPLLSDPKDIITLESLVQSWIGSRQITSVDLSTVEAKVDSIVAGALLSIIYEFIFWGQNTDMSGIKQPLLVVIDEAHRLLPSGSSNLLSQVVKRIAKEGRKFGQGLMIVTQRASEVDETILSQLGSIVALRTTNSNDRSRILSIVPDEFGGLSSVLPALRNGESFIVGESVPIPTRMRTSLARGKIKGHDPLVTESWTKVAKATTEDYQSAYNNWLNRTL